jgi:hypothetical protein
MSEPFLLVEFLLSNGNIDRFELTDPQQVKIWTEVLSPQKIYAGPPITLSEEHGLYSYRVQSIVRVDLSGPSTPNWPYLGNAVTVTQVSEQEFEESSNSAEIIRQRREAWDRPGTSQEGFTVLNLSSGERIIWRIKMKSTEMVAIDVATVSRHFFSAGALHGRRSDGGLTIVNTTHVVNMSFHPGPPQRSGSLLSVKKI